MENPFALFRGSVLALEMHLERLKYTYAGVLVVLVLLAAFGFVLCVPAEGFYTGSSTSIHVDPGTSVRKEAALLRNAHLVRSTFLFRVLYRVMPGIHGVQAGDYEFSRPASEFQIAWNLAHGITSTVSVTFPEGFTARQMGAALKHAEPNFDDQAFDSLAIPHEGYLFPDTYYVSVSMTPEYAVDMLLRNDTDHLQKYQDQIAASGHSEREILTMASLLEGEGKTLDDRRMIAGILWHRIAIGMPLQVDATFGYIYGQTGYVPTSADMKSNSAYNTYRYKGLPPTPINNPGDESILAALTPTKSDYLYYLTGTDGQMHYAKTFAEHIANQKKYLQ